MKNLEELLAEISRNKNLAKEFKKLKNTEEFIKFCENLGAKVTEEELREALLAKIPKSAEMSDEELELIAGGRMDFRKVQSLVLAATTFMGVAGGIAPSTFAAQGQNSVKKEKKLENELLQAMKDSDYSKCKRLLKKGVPATSIVLVETAKCCDNVEIMKLILKMHRRICSEPYWSCDMEFYAWLQACSYNNNKEIIQFFLDNGYNGRKIIYDIIHEACIYNTAEILNFLLDKAEEFGKSEKRIFRYYLTTALEHEDLGKVKAFVEHGTQVGGYHLDEALKKFRKSNNPEILKYLLQQRVDNKPAIEVIDAQYFLQTACELGNIELAKSLVDIGVNPTSRCVSIALKNENMKLLKFLLSCLNEDMLSAFSEYKEKHSDIEEDKLFKMARKQLKEMEKSII